MASLKHGRSVKQNFRENRHFISIAPLAEIDGHDGILMDAPIIPATRHVRTSDATSATVLFIRAVMNPWENGWSGKIGGEYGHVKDALSSMYRLLQTTLQRTLRHPSKN